MQCCIFKLYKNKQAKKISHQKERCNFKWSHVWCWILNKITISIIAPLSDTHCCLTAIRGLQVQTGFWGFFCSIPLIFSESDVSSLLHAYPILIMKFIWGMKCYNVHKNCKVKPLYFFKTYKMPMANLRIYDPKKPHKTYKPMLF